MTINKICIQIILINNSKLKLSINKNSNYKIRLKLKFKKCFKKNKYN